MFNLKVYKHSDTATIPTKAHSGAFADACYDLFYDGSKGIIGIRPGERALIPTGLSILIPDGYWVKFHERSGMAYKYGLMIMAGVIDSGFTNEWNILAYNSSATDTLIIKPNDKLVQFSLERVNPCEFTEITEGELAVETLVRERGLNGWGSSN